MSLSLESVLEDNWYRVFALNSVASSLAVLHSDVPVLEVISDVLGLVFIGFLLYFLEDLIVGEKRKVPPLEFTKNASRAKAVTLIYVIFWAALTLLIRFSTPKSEVAVQALSLSLLLVLVINEILLRRTRRRGLGEGRTDPTAPI